MTNAKRHDATTPDDPTPEEVLYDALRDNLSPQAVAAIAAYLQPARLGNADVQRQVEWFRDLLIEMLGESRMDRLTLEAGL